MESKLRLNKGVIPAGVKFNSWTATGETQLKKQNSVMVKMSLFECDCGVQKWKKDSDVRSGRVKRCFDCSVILNGQARKAKSLTAEQQERKNYVDRLWPN